MTIQNWLTLTIFWYLFSCGCSIQANGTIVHVSKPANGAFLARDILTNTANLELTGYVEDLNFNEITVYVYQSGVTFKSFNNKLSFKNGKATFKYETSLPAGKFTYQIIYHFSGSSTFSDTVNNIIVGDVYLVQGQSNAAAGDYLHNENTQFDTTYSDPYIRSFGTGSVDPKVVTKDLNWYTANANTIEDKGSIGQWAAVMAKSLLDSFQIPICIINGAVGGTWIEKHLPDLSNPENCNTIYGRLLYRVKQAGLQNNVRGLIYFQGESDGVRAEKHRSLFISIYNRWKKDYPSLEKVYVVQVRAGCGNPSIELRDEQRKFEFTLPNCQVISANGLNNHDGCHYGFKDGYELLGIQLATLMERDFYFKKLQNIDPPNIGNCMYSNKLETEITIEMKNRTMLEVDSNFFSLFKIEGDQKVKIINGYLKNNTIVLVLNTSSKTITGLTYDGLSGVQPWVKNELGMGLISFYNVSVLPFKP